MTENTPDQSERLPRDEQGYVLNDTKAHEWFAARTASVEAGFFLSHLRPGISLLDCGCGPGSVTVSMAEVVAPGTVVGIDIQPGQIEAASALAAQKNLRNVRFETSNVNELPFPDASFDAVFANALLMHLRNPLSALKEMRRVLKPGGVVGVRDRYVNADLWMQPTPLLKKWHELVLRTLQSIGASPNYAPEQRRLLLEAGFTRAEAYTDAQSYGTPERTSLIAHFFVEALRGQGFRGAIQQGLVDEATLEAIEAELLAWSKRPDSLFVWIWCSAVGWAPN